MATITYNAYSFKFAHTAGILVLSEILVLCNVSALALRRGTEQQLPSDVHHGLTVGLLFERTCSEGAMQLCGMKLVARTAPPQ